MKTGLVRIKGLLRRWYRKRFRKNMSVVEDGLWFFQEFADIYGDSVNDIDAAERFFTDFMKETGGGVIVDFLDTDNWDCIRKVEVDKKNGLIWFYWQIPKDPITDMMRKMAFPLDYYGMCLKFDNVRFIRGKRGKCFGICVNGFTIREKNTKGFGKADGWDVRWMDSNSSFFATRLVRTKDNTSQIWRFMNTPISSFWIIPKMLNIRPQDSEKYLYQIGLEKCDKMIEGAIKRIGKIGKTRPDQQRIEIKGAGNEMRNAAENLFKLVTCFYQEKYQFQVKNYDDLKLGDLTGPLKKTIYTSEQEQEWLGEVARIANDLSHDSGNPVTASDVCQLYGILHFFIDDFKTRIYQKGRDIEPIKKSGKPSPKEYVNEHFQELCFKEEIDEVVGKDLGKVSFVIQAQVGSFVDFLSKRGDCVLCEDGFFRYIDEDKSSPVLKIWNREEVVILTDRIEERINTICEDNGFDTEYYSLGLSLDAVLHKEANPSHLFTEEEIKALMVDADDSVNNKLVIDEDGYARVIQDPSQGHLYPVSQETWCADNRYVGKNSKLTDLHDSYVLCMHLWLSYLHTGVRQYDDMFMSDDGMDELIKEIMKFYA